MAYRRASRFFLRVACLEDRTTPTVLFSENFDGVIAPALPAGWSSSSTGAGSPWVTSNVGLAAAASGHTLPNAAFATNATNAGETRLFSPVGVVTGVAPQLSFK